MVSKSIHPFIPIETDIPEAVFLINSEGTIRFATPAAANYYGYHLEDIIGRSVLRLVAPQDADLLVTRWDAFINNPKAQFDETVVAMVLANGRQILMRLSVWRLPGPDDFLLLHHVQERSSPRRLEVPNSILALDTTLEEIRRMVPCETITLIMRETSGKYRMVRMQGRQVELSTRMLDSLNDYETTRIIRETGRPLVLNDCRSDSRWTASSSREHVRSWLGAPLIHQGEFLGLLNLDRTEPNTFNEREVTLVQTLANQVATALYNIRQYEEELRRAERFEALNEVSQAISRLDLEDVLEVVYRKISNLMDTSSFFIGLYDAEAGEVCLAGAYEHGIHQSDQIIEADLGLIGEVLRTRQSVIIHNVTEQGLPPNVIVEGEESESLMMMPLIAQDNIVGVISVQSYAPNAFTQDDVVMLETIAGPVATAIQNAQLYDQTANRLEALGALHQMGLELSAVKEPERVVELTVKTVLELFHPGQVRLFIPGDSHWDSKLWIGHATGRAEQPRIRLYERPIPDSLTEQVHFSGKPAILYNLTDEKEFQAEYRTAWLIHAAIAYPLQRGATQLGVLTLLHSEPQFFRHDVLRVLELLCMQAASALENAQYYVTLRRRFDEVSGLQDLARQVSASQSLDDILHIVVRTIQDIYGCKSAGIALVDEDRVVYRAAAGLKDEYFKRANFKIGQGVAGRVAAGGKPIYVPDTYADHQFRIIDPEVRCMLAVPLTTHDEVIGVLSIDSSLPHAFTPDHERLLNIAGSQIAAAIETIRLLQETRSHAAELAQANATLNELDDLRNELIQNLSHELRSPLALVRGYAGLLRDNELGPITKDQADALGIIDDKADSITRMINDILSLEQIRPETMEMCPLDLTDLCYRAVEGAQLVYQDRQVEFETHLIDTTCMILGDRVRLDQVFDNLIGNAVKFSPNGGTVTVSSTYDHSDQGIEISIADQGIGIPADKLPHIFERFYQADRSIKHRFGGAGLGLSIVHRIIEAHHGQIWVESQEGKGSTFTFSLPLVSER